MSYDESPAGYYEANQAKMALVGQGGLMRRTKMERLHDLKKQVETKLEEVNTAIKLLEENPKMNEVIEALEKVGI